jgi:hypothetical protein
VLSSVVIEDDARECAGPGEMLPFSNSGELPHPDPEIRGLVDRKNSLRLPYLSNLSPVQDWVGAIVKMKYQFHQRFKCLHRGKFGFIEMIRARINSKFTGDPTTS